jgi:histidine triad (HIT) family protein
MSTIFSKIIEGELPAYIVAENDSFLAFLDIMPIQKGHVLVIPKKEVDFIFDMEDNELAAFILFAKQVARKIKKVLPCKKIGLSVVGLEVPHAHIHLMPINKIDDMNFANDKLKFSSEEMKDLAVLIQNA